MSTEQLSSEVLEKLEIMRNDLGADDLNTALNKSLNIAHFVSDILKDSKNKLLVERNGKFEWINDSNGA